MGIHYGQLDLNKRIEPWRHHNAGTVSSEIARIIGRHPWAIGANSGATVYRRLAKNRLGGPNGLLAPSTKLADQAPETAEGSYRRAPGPRFDLVSYTAIWRAPRRAGATAAKLTALFADLHKPARRSITFNNGSECVHHNKLERELSLISFFYGPHSA